MAATVCLGVERAALVLVLAVGQVQHLDEGGGHRLGEGLAVGEPGRDSRFVGGGGREGLGRQLAARILRELAGLA